jgi:hypothetical protein
LGNCGIYERMCVFFVSFHAKSHLQFINSRRAQLSDFTFFFLASLSFNPHCTTGSVSRYWKVMDRTCDSRKLFIGRLERALEMRVSYLWLFEQGILSFVYKRLAAKAVIELDAFRISGKRRCTTTNGSLRLPSF